MSRNQIADDNAMDENVVHRYLWLKRNPPKNWSEKEADSIANHVANFVLSITKERDAPLLNKASDDLESAVSMYVGSYNSSAVFQRTCRKLVAHKFQEQHQSIFDIDFLLSNFPFLKEHTYTNGFTALETAICDTTNTDVAIHSGWYRPEVISGRAIRYALVSGATSRTNKCFSLNSLPANHQHLMLLAMADSQNLAFRCEETYAYQIQYVRTVPGRHLFNGLMLGANIARIAQSLVADDLECFDRPIESFRGDSIEACITQVLGTKNLTALIHEIHAAQKQAEMLNFTKKNLDYTVDSVRLFTAYSSQLDRICSALAENFELLKLRLKPSTLMKTILSAYTPDIHDAPRGLLTLFSADIPCLGTAKLLAMCFGELPASEFAQAALMAKMPGRILIDLIKHHELLPPLHLAAVAIWYQCNIGDTIHKHPILTIEQLAEFRSVLHHVAPRVLTDKSLTYGLVVNSKGKSYLTQADLARNVASVLTDTVRLCLTEDKWELLQSREYHYNAELHNSRLERVYSQTDFNHSNTQNSGQSTLPGYPIVSDIRI